MPVTPGFHHSTMVARAAARTIAFYHELLGLRLLHEDAGQLLFGDDAASAGSLLSFVIAPELRRGRWGVGGIHHLALGVQDEATQLMWKRWLVDHGVAISGPYDRGWFKSIYFSDPDGQILEIATHGPGYDLDEPIERLGQHVALPKAQQLRGHRDEAAIAALTHPDPVREITAAMKLDGIHHITGLTHDVEALGAFYGQALGLALVKRSVNQDDPATPHLFWANYDGARVAPRSSLTMFGWPRSDYRARPGTGQTQSIGFRAGGAELAHWREQLQAAGAAPGEITDRGYFSSLTFTAPDGLIMEIASDAQF